MQRTKKNKEIDRRYPKDRHPNYDHVYEWAVQESGILNSEARSSSISWADVTSNPIMYLEELEGQSVRNGFIQFRGEWKLAAIPVFEQELKELHGRFREWSKQQVIEGISLHPPKVWPKELLTLRLKKEALLDVRRREADKLREIIADQEAEREKKKKAAILPNGPIGKKDGIRAKDKEQNPSYDGQKISHTNEGIPFIDEPESPYHRMPLFFYKQMVDKWRKEMGLDNDSLFAERDQRFFETRKAATEAGKELPEKRGSIHKIRKQKLAKITSNNWPKWPKDAKPINEIK